MRYTSSRSAVTLAVALACLVGGAVAASAGSTSSEHATSSLSLKAALSLRGDGNTCVPPASVDACATRTITGPFPGLGQVAGTYTYLVDNGQPSCAGGLFKALAYPIRFAVASKGEIQADVAEGAQCVEEISIRTQPQTFTITGGTGVYAGASGSGTLERVLGQETCRGSVCGRFGHETWTGTLTVPGVEFDVTAPTFSGATSRTVKATKGAKSARVTYQVTAQDDRDGGVPATCAPKSGFPFRIGKTKVTCTATDSSANTAAATFTVTVKRAR
jgi:hypothetical protein